MHAQFMPNHACNYARAMYASVVKRMMHACIRISQRNGKTSLTKRVVVFGKTEK